LGCWSRAPSFTEKNSGQATEQAAIYLQQFSLQPMNDDEGVLNPI
jgi:hypothetical protein